MNGPLSFNWGLNAEDLADQQQNYAAQEADDEDGDTSENNGDYELSETNGFYGDSSNFWG